MFMENATGLIRKKIVTLTLIKNKKQKGKYEKGKNIKNEKKKLDPIVKRKS